MLLYTKCETFCWLFGFYFCAVVGSHAHSESYWLKILLHIAEWHAAFMFCLNYHKDDNRELYTVSDFLRKVLIIWQNS